LRIKALQSQTKPDGVTNSISRNFEPMRIQASNYHPQNKRNSYTFKVKSNKVRTLTVNQNLKNSEAG
jgi:hypothetical protein